MPRSYVTQHRAHLPRRPDPRRFRPMKRGGFSLLDIPFWAVTIVAAAWLPHHTHGVAELVAALAALGIVGGVTVSMIKILIHRRRSKPMVESGDEPFC